MDLNENLEEKNVLAVVTVAVVMVVVYGSILWREGGKRREGKGEGS